MMPPRGPHPPHPPRGRFHAHRGPPRGAFEARPFMGKGIAAHGGGVPHEGRLPTGLADRDLDELMEIAARDSVRTAMQSMQESCAELLSECSPPDASWLPFGGPEPMIEPGMYVDPAVDYALMDLPWNSAGVASGFGPSSASDAVGVAEPALNVDEMGSSEAVSARISRAMEGPRRAVGMIIRDSFPSPALAKPVAARSDSSASDDSSSDDSAPEDSSSSTSSSDVDSSSTASSSGSAYSSSSSFLLGGAGVDSVLSAASSAASMAAIDVMPVPMPMPARPCQKGAMAGMARPALLYAGAGSSSGSGSSGPSEPDVFWRPEDDVSSSPSEPRYDPSVYDYNFAPPSYGVYGSYSPDQQLPLKCMLQLAPKMGSDMCQASVLRLQDAVANLHDVRAAARAHARPYDWDYDMMGPAPAVDAWFVLLPLLVLVQLIVLPLAIIKAARRRAAEARADRVFIAIHADAQLKAAVEAAAREAVPEPKRSSDAAGAVCQKVASALLGVVVVLLSFAAVSFALDACYSNSASIDGISSSSSSGSSSSSASEWTPADSEDDSEDDYLWYSFNPLTIGLWWLAFAGVLLALKAVYGSSSGRRAAAAPASTAASAPPSDGNNSGSNGAAAPVGVPVTWHPHPAQPYAYAPMAQATTGTGAAHAEGTYTPPAMQNDTIV